MLGGSSSKVLYGREEKYPQSSNVGKAVLQKRLDTSPNVDGNTWELNIPGNIIKNVSNIQRHPGG